MRWVRLYRQIESDECPWSMNHLKLVISSLDYLAVVQEFVNIFPFTPCVDTGTIAPFEDFYSGSMIKMVMGQNNLFYRHFPATC